LSLSFVQVLGAMRYVNKYLPRSPVMPSGCWLFSELFTWFSSLVFKYVAALRLDYYLSVGTPQCLHAKKNVIKYDTETQNPLKLCCWALHSIVSAGTHSVLCWVTSLACVLKVCTGVVGGRKSTIYNFLLKTLTSLPQEKGFPYCIGCMHSAPCLWDRWKNSGRWDREKINFRFCKSQE
jgi:hypothetical protein